jgi:hypothetical protein
VIALILRFVHRNVSLALLAGLLAFIAGRGLVPSLTKVDSDFPNYFTAAKLVTEGADAGRFYDDAWFQTQMRRYGFDKPGKFSPFPPPTALLLVPLAKFEPLTALRIVTIGSVLLLAGVSVALAEIARWRRVDSAVFVLLSGFAIVNALRLGQPYIVASGLCVAGFYAYSKGRPFLGGLCFGLLLPIKYFPAAILLYFVIVRKWRVVAGGVTASLAVVALGVAVMGLKIHETFLRSVLGDHLTAHLTMQNPYSVAFQSFDTLSRRLFVFDAVLNPHPALSFAELQVVSVIVIKVAIVALTVAALTRVRQRRTEIPAEFGIGLLGVAFFLVAPATASYHLLFLWLPVGLLISYFRRERATTPYAYATLGAYTAIGFFPYKVAYAFDGAGVLTILAYPRLFLLLAMFAICVSFALRTAAPPVLPPRIELTQ